MNTRNKSRSEEFLDKRGEPPQVTPKMVKSVSQYRRAVLEREAEDGFFRDGSTNSRKPLNTELGNVLGASDGLRKTAQISSASSFGGQWRGSGDTVRQNPEIYSPLWLTSNLNLPRDRATINAWCRSFFTLNPIVHNAINLHSTYPISKLNIKCHNKDIENFFNEMAEEIDLMNICVQIAQEYWLLGEAFVHAELDQRTLKWSRLLIQNPDYIVVKRSVVAHEPIIMLKPDENLKRIVMSNKPSDIEQKRQLPDHIIDSVKRGQNIPLDNFNISHLARRTSPYEVRGTGLPVSIFRQLILMDKFRESKFAQSDEMVNPITLIKIGSADYKPQIGDLEAWREVFEQAQSDKNFKIFTHEGVTVEKIGSASGIYDISGDITQLIKEMYIGLMVPQVIMDSGDITYANGTVALDVLRQRYMQFRNMLSTWLKRKIFAPISKMNGFYDHKNGKKTLIIPDIDWNHMSLFDANDYIQTLVSLTGDDKNRVSLQSLYRSLGLEWEDEKRKIRKEAIQTAIHKKEVANLDKMPLNELRSLDEDDEIQEINDGPLPGEVSSDPTAPPAGGDMGLPGMAPPGDAGPSPPPDMGALPPPPK